MKTGEPPQKVVKAKRLGSQQCWMIKTKTEVKKHNRTLGFRPASGSQETFFVGISEGVPNLEVRMLTFMSYLIKAKLLPI